MCLSLTSLCASAGDESPPQHEQDGHQNSVYKNVDKSGRVIFSDKPSKNSQVIDTTPLNLHEGMAGESMSGEPRNDKENDAPKKTLRYSVSLISPQPGYRLGPAEKTLHIAISTTPPLESTHKVQFYVGGKSVGPPSRALSTRAPMGMTMRGQRSVSARIVDENGKTLGGSNAVTIHVIRPY